MANRAVARAGRSPSSVVPGLLGDDRLLEARQQQLRIRQGQTQIGDIAEIGGPNDLHDVRALSLTFSASFHHPHNPSHASTLGQRPGVKLPLGAYTPNYETVPRDSVICGPTRRTLLSLETAGNLANVG
jgi:hypothetical protein